MLYLEIMFHVNPKWESLCYNERNKPLTTKGVFPLNEEKYAIIDIGSNTIRLVIYLKEKSGRFQEIENVKAVARLKNYLEENHYLNQEGMGILANIVRSFKEVTDTYELNGIICVATATIRQAENKAEIIQKIAQESGYDTRILSEEEEAYYGYLAVVNSTTVSEGITIDIGGGSTELTYFKDRQLVYFKSMPFGALTLKQMFVEHDVPTEREMEQIKTYLQQQFTSIPWLYNKQVHLIGIGGSARNMIQIDQALKKYPLAGVHQYRIQENNMGYVKNHLRKFPFKELQKVEGLSKDRADIILPAIEVFHTLYEHTGATSFMLSRKGLRDGIFYEQIMHDFGITKFPNVREESFNELIVDFNINYKQVHQVITIATKIFDALRNSGLGYVGKIDYELLKRGAYVFNLGKYIDSESSSQHTFYLLANRTIDGLMHTERLKIALVASFKSKHKFKQYLKPFKEWFVKEEKKKLQTIGALLKLAYCFDSTKRNIVKDMDMLVDEEVITIHVYCDKDWMPEAYQVEKQKKHLEKALHRNINVCFCYQQ